VKEVTSVYTPERNKFGPGTVSEKGFFINPFGIGCQSLEQFHPLRRELLFRDLRAYASQPLALSDYEGVNPYLYEQKGRYVLFLTNTTWEDFPILRFELLNLPISKIERLSRKTGKAQKVSFVRHGNRYVLDSEFAPLSTACLLLYPERKAS
jgi:hypothetical protein